MQLRQLHDYDEFCCSQLVAGLQIKPLTRRLIYNLLWDLLLEPPLLVDFGVEHAGHYEALKAALFCDSQPVESEGDDPNQLLEDLGQRITQLDAAYGNSAKLNAFVQGYAPQYADVYFQPTSWDLINGQAGAGEKE